MDCGMKAKGPTKEWNSESRVRENRLHGLMRGRSRRRIAKLYASLRSRLSPTLLGHFARIFLTRHL